ncbi:MAG: HNH endonuclease [Anaerolineae bacterium]|nr:HNH endonuclease [Anaerolineae bacterium]
MTGAALPQVLRQLVRTRANSRCEYCQTSEWLSGLPCEIDHIIPQAKGGLTTDDNLCLACSSCNGHKQATTQALDPESGQEKAGMVMVIGLLPLAASATQ